METPRRRGDRRGLDQDFAAGSAPGPEGFREPFAKARARSGGCPGDQDPHGPELLRQGLAGHLTTAHPLRRTPQRHTVAAITRNATRRSSRTEEVLNGNDHSTMGVAYIWQTFRNRGEALRGADSGRHSGERRALFPPRAR